MSVAVTYITEVTVLIRANLYGLGPVLNQGALESLHRLKRLR